MWLKMTWPAPSLVKSWPAPWSLICPEMFSAVPALAPRTTAVGPLASWILPAQVLLPAKLSRAPSLAGPGPLRITVLLITPETLFNWIWAFDPTVVTEELGLPRALLVLIRIMPPLLSTLIGPVKPLLSLFRNSVPPSSLLSVEPVVPTSLPSMVRSAPALI